MVLLELFSGIGGFSLGLEKAGFHFDKLYFSEIDRHAIANFKYNYPYAEYIGKVETVIETGIERPNIITFGSPCQDFSVAGIGKGLGGDRSSLISYAIEVIRHFRPDVFIWENVKGVLFTRHRTDLFTILKAFTDVGGYHIEWQLLNTAWFLPQNRERIYLVGRVSEKCAGHIFPVGSEDTQGSGASQEPVPSHIGTITKSYGRASNIVPYIQVIPPGGHYKPFMTAIDYNSLRMVTEIEGERLPGFPDDYTRYGDYDGEIREISRSIRYGLLGNAVSVLVVEQVGTNIKLTTNL